MFVSLGVTWRVVFVFYKENGTIVLSLLLPVLSIRKSNPENMNSMKIATIFVKSHFLPFCQDIFGNIFAQESHTLIL
jgi:hypothetical protein